MLTSLLSACLVGGVVLLIVGFAASIVFAVLRGIRAADALVERMRTHAVAYTTPGPDGSFLLEFASPGPELGVWAGLSLLCKGGEEEDRLRVTLSVRANGVELTSGSFKLGEEATSPLAGMHRALATRSRPAAGGARFTSTMALAPISSAAPGTRIEVRGRVTPAPGVTIERCEIYATSVGP